LGSINRDLREVRKKGYRQWKFEEEGEGSVNNRSVER